MYAVDTHQHKRRIKKPFPPNKPLALMISPVFWLIMNVLCIEAACRVLSVYAEMKIGKIDSCVKYCWLTVVKCEEKN